MRYDFDQAKADSNLAKHGVAFSAVVGFDFGTAKVRATAIGGEPRLRGLGLIGQRVHVLIYTVENGLRVISLRKGNNREVDEWESE